MYEDSIDNNHDKIQHSIHRIRELKINDSNLKSSKSILNNESPQIGTRHSRKEPILAHHDINIDLIKKHRSIDTLQRSKPTIVSSHDLTRLQINDVRSSLTMPPKIFNSNRLIASTKRDEALGLNNNSYLFPSQNNGNSANEKIPSLPLKDETSNGILQEKTLKQQSYLLHQYPSNIDRLYMNGNKTDQPQNYDNVINYNLKNHFPSPISNNHDTVFLSSNEVMNKASNESLVCYNNGINIGNKDYDAIYGNQSYYNSQRLSPIVPHSGKLNKNIHNEVYKKEVDIINQSQDYDLQSVSYIN